jgi:hypothetical protein
MDFHNIDLKNIDLEKLTEEEEMQFLRELAERLKGKDLFPEATAEIRRHFQNVKYVPDNTIPLV